MEETSPEGFTKGLKGRGRNLSGSQKFVVFRRSSKKLLINSTQINFTCEEPVREKKTDLIFLIFSCRDLKAAGVG